MGIDYGSTRIGVAFADADTQIATPYSTIDNNDGVIHNLVELCKQREVGLIVLGESKTFSGNDNPIMKQIRSFKKILEKRTDLPVVFVPEFYTSAQARRQPEAAKHVDGSAAAIILQSYLNDQSNEEAN